MNKFEAFVKTQIKKSSRENLDEVTLAFLKALGDLLLLKDRDTEYSTEDIKTNMTTYLSADQVEKVNSQSIGYLLKKFDLADKRRQEKGMKYFIRKAEIADVLYRFQAEITEDKLDE